MWCRNLSFPNAWPLAYIKQLILPCKSWFARRCNAGRSLRRRRSLFRRCTGSRDLLQWAVALQKQHNQQRRLFMLKSIMCPVSWHRFIRSKLRTLDSERREERARLRDTCQGMSLVRRNVSHVMCVCVCVCVCRCFDGQRQQSTLFHGELLSSTAVYW